MQSLKKHVLYKNVCRMNKMYTYYNDAMLSLTVTYDSCITSMPFTNPLQCPHGIVKCPLDAHFRTLLEVVNYLGTVRLLFYEYYQ